MNKLNIGILILIVFFTNCSSQQINKSTLKISINNLVDNYINYYQSKNKDFTIDKKYLLVGLNQEQDNTEKIFVYISDNCYKCPGIINEKDNIYIYKGFKVILYTDTDSNMIFLKKIFKNLSSAQRFSVEPYKDNVMYHSPRLWRIEYDDKGKLLFFCNSILNELKETKEFLKLDNSVEDCNLN